jgi:hypothetical protein
MITKRTLAIVAALVARGAFLQGEERDVASLHQFNLLAEVNGDFRVMFHNRLRFYNDISDFLQYRTGLILFYDWKPRIQWLAGYYLLEQRSNDTFLTIQRPWLGASINAYRSARVRVDWRTLLERHMYSGPGDFTRTRTRAMATIQSKSGWQPYASAEALALKGHVIGRYTTGVNYATQQGHVFGVGYEFRQDVGRPGSHFLATLIQFQIAGPRKREKPSEAEAPE